MKKLIFSGLLLCLSLFGYSQIKNVWHQYVPKNTASQFKIECTDSLSYIVDTLETDMGELIIENYYTPDPQDTSYIYMITSMVYPKSVLPSDKELDEDMLSNIIVGSAQEMLGRVVYSSDVSTDEVSVKVYRISYNNDKKSIKGRVLRHENTIYNIQVAAHSDNNLDPRIDRFLDSFMIIEE